MYSRAEHGQLVSRRFGRVHSKIWRAASEQWAWADRDATGRRRIGSSNSTPERCIRCGPGCTRPTRHEPGIKRLLVETGQTVSHVAVATRWSFPCPVPAVG